MPPPPPIEPRMARWTHLLYHLGGGPTRHYDEDFFNWWAKITFCVDEYSYVGMDYHGNPDLPLLVNAQWGDIGMISVFCVFLIYMIFFLYASLINMCIFMD